MNRIFKNDYKALYVICKFNILVMNTRIGVQYRMWQNKNDHIELMFIMVKNLNAVKIKFNDTLRHVRK